MNDSIPNKPKKKELELNHLSFCFDGPRNSLPTSHSIIHIKPRIVYITLARNSRMVGEVQCTKYITHK